MPGFVTGGSGGPGPSSGVETLREHRWRITQLGPMDRDTLLFARDLTLPDNKINELEILGSFLIYKFAKSVRWDDVTVVFYDDGRLLNEMNTWRDLVYTNDDGIKVHSPGSGYKQDAEFQLLDGMGSPINTVRLKNAWPKNISQGRLTYTSSNIKQITLVLAYDFAEVS